MTDTEKIIYKTKEFILNLYSEGYSTHQNMIDGLKNGIDYFVGFNIEDIDKLKNDIISTCLKEFELQTKVYDKEGHLMKIEKIKSDFVNFVKELNAKEIIISNPLAFERRLSAKESENLTRSLKEKFDFDSWKKGNYYWEPLVKTETKQTFIYFKTSLFQKKDINSLISILDSISGNRIYFMTEEHLNYEIELSILNFDWIECAFCDFQNDWLIYVSHEGSITFSGQKLLYEIEHKFIDKMENKNPWE